MRSGRREIEAIAELTRGRVQPADRTGRSRREGRDRHGPVGRAEALAHEVGKADKLAAARVRTDANKALDQSAVALGEFDLGKIVQAVHILERETTGCTGARGSSIASARQARFINGQWGRIERELRRVIDALHQQGDRLLGVIRRVGEVECGIAGLTIATGVVVVDNRPRRGRLRGPGVSGQKLGQGGASVGRIDHPGSLGDSWHSTDDIAETHRRLHQPGGGIEGPDLRSTSCHDEGGFGVVGVADAETRLHLAEQAEAALINTRICREIRRVGKDLSATTPRDVDRG